MKILKLALSIVFMFVISTFVSAQTASKGVTVNNNGAKATNSKGGGVTAKKGEVTAKGNKGNGATANKKGLEVKGSKGGMTIEKKKLQIKSKNVNIKLGK